VGKRNLICLEFLQGEGYVLHLPQSSSRRPLREMKNKHLRRDLHNSLFPLHFPRSHFTELYKENFTMSLNRSHPELIISMSRQNLKYNQSILKLFNVLISTCIIFLRSHDMLKNLSNNIIAFNN